MDYSPSSYRAWAVLGLPANPAVVERRAKERFIAFQMRRNIQLVSKKWNQLGEELLYRTIFVNERTRRSLTFLLTKALISSEVNFLRHVRRFELDFDITKYTIESIGPLVRVIAQSCPNLEIVDDTIRRTGYEKKRAVSPLRLDVQASFELPFSLALGNKKYQSVCHARFSSDSYAAFTLPYNINLLQRFPNLHILSLHDLPAWKQIPYDRTPPPPRPRRNYWGREEEEEEEEEVGADNEAEQPKPLTFHKLHTFDISRLETKSPKACTAMSTYLSKWVVPSVTQLGISIYNPEAIPHKLFKQFSSRLTTLFLHNLNVDKDQKKIIDLPALKHLVVIGPNVGQWDRVFSCTSVTKYTMVWEATTFSYSCRPTPVDWDKERDFAKNWFSKWTQTKAHMGLCRDQVLLPNLEEIHIADCLFQSDQWKDDVSSFWTRWHKEMDKRGVRLIGCEGYTWPEARARMPPPPAPAPAPTGAESTPGTTAQPTDTAATTEAATTMEAVTTNGDTEDATRALPLSPKPAKAAKTTQSRRSRPERRRTAALATTTAQNMDTQIDTSSLPQETGPAASEAVPEVTSAVAAVPEAVTSAAPPPPPPPPPEAVAEAASEVEALEAALDAASISTVDPSRERVLLSARARAKAEKAARLALSKSATPVITIAAATAPSPATTVSTTSRLAPYVEGQ
jgi:hypothetical protein